VSGDSPVRLAMRAGVCAGTAIPAVALTLMACASAPLGVRAPAARQIPVGLDLYMPVPSDNPMTAEKIALGQQLFFDRRLSRDGTLSCSSCHDPAHAFADRRTVSVGIGGRRGRRNVPTLVNRGYGRAFSWDGRAPSLEAQVLEPIANPVELGMPIAGLL
jgi:cytochrome c peroxidase